jgi:small subunit ribosomal protein S2
MTKNTHAAQLQKIVAHIGSVEMNAWMFPYVVGYRDRVPLFNVEETLLATKKALFFVQKIRKKGGSILLVNTNPAYSKLVEKTATLTYQPYVNEFWVGGLLTNWRQLKYSVHAYKKFEKFFSKMMDEDRMVFPKYAKAKKRFEGVQDMKKMPSALLLFQATTTYRHIIDEAHRLNIPVITFMDTYAPQVGVEYPIPVNVHSKAFFHFFCRLFVKVAFKKQRTKVVFKRQFRSPVAEVASMKRQAKVAFTKQRRNV